MFFEIYAGNLKTRKTAMRTVEADSIESSIVEDGIDGVTRAVGFPNTWKLYVKSSGINSAEEFRIQFEQHVNTPGFPV